MCVFVYPGKRLSDGDDLNVYGPFQLGVEAGSMQLVGQPFPLVRQIIPTDPVEHLFHKQIPVIIYVQT